MCKYPDVQIDLRDDGSTHAKIIRLVGSGKKVLEFGTATGYMSKVFKEQGCRVVGLEIDTEAARLAEKYCERVITGDVERPDLAAVLKDEKFDVMVFADFLEHLKDPERVLTAVRNSFADGGYLVASIPNIAHASVRLRLLAGRFDYEELGILDGTHLRFYTRESIIRQFERCGYLVEIVDRMTPDLDSKFWLPFPEELRKMLAAWLANDPESRVVQYVVKARPAGEPQRLLLLRDQISEKEAAIEQLTKQAAQSEETIGRLEGELAKIRGTLAYSMYKAIVLPIKNLWRRSGSEG
jgi:SAM-dependent methyltransferase